MAQHGRVDCVSKGVEALSISTYPCLSRRHSRDASSHLWSQIKPDSYLGGRPLVEGGFQSWTKAISKICLYRAQRRSLVGQPKNLQQPSFVQRAAFRRGTLWRNMLLTRRFETLKTHSRLRVSMKEGYDRPRHTETFKAVRHRYGK